MDDDRLPVGLVRESELCTEELEAVEGQVKVYIKMSERELRSKGDAVAAVVLALKRMGWNIGEKHGASSHMNPKLWGCEKGPRRCVIRLSGAGWRGS